MVDHIIPANGYQPQAELTIRSLETLKIYTDVRRRRILALLSAEPRSVKYVAAQLGLPFTRLYYHFNILEKHGLIKLVQTRPIGGGVEEKYYQVTARQFVVDSALMAVDAEAQRDTLDTIIAVTLDLTATDIRQSVQNGTLDLRPHSPDPAALLLRHGIMQLSPEQARHFHEQLVRLVDDFQMVTPETGAAFYGVTFAVYPKPP